MNDNILETKVKAYNALNEMILDIAPAFVEMVKPFDGVKIVLGTGEFSAKFKSAMKELQAQYPKLQGYWNTPSYSLSYVFRVMRISENGKSVYAEKSVYFADVAPGGVVKLIPQYDFKPSDYQEVYSVATIQAARNRIKQLQTEISREQSKLNFFGEFDR